ncbi:MAG: MATE family efflux transporter [Flavobacteriales bacterium]|nr:MAG: MATE family efflux transporter [Flavobacteriales bacterium]
MQKVPLKEINRLALPAIIAGTAEPIIGLVDNAVVGHLGTTELAGVGIATALFTSVIWLLAQTKSAISAIVSQYLGRGQTEQLKNLIPQAIILNLFLGLLFFAGTAVFSVELLQLYNAKGAVLQFANEYYLIRAIGFPLTLATFGIFGIFRGLQNTSWAMKISLAGVSLNVILDVVLVYGIEGMIPSFGVKGAAIASLLSQVLMLALAVIYLLKKTPFNFHFKVAISPELWILIRMSGELFIRTIALQVAYFLGTRFAAGYGDEYVAAHTIAMNIWLFSAFFIDGYSAAGNAISGRLLGAKDFKTIYNYGFQINKINLLISFLLAAGYLIGYQFIGNLFTKDAQVIAIFNAIFWLVILSQPINAVAFAFDGVFKGLGEMRYLMYTLLIATFMGFVPVIFITDYIGWNIYGVWVAYLIWMVMRGGILLVKFKMKYKPINAV